VFTAYDIVIAPFCILLLWLILSVKVRKYDPGTAALFKKAFKFKVFCAIAFTLVTAFYYGGGDSEMFYYSVKDMREAIAHNDLSYFELLKMESTDEYSPLAYYFELDNQKYPVAGFMRSASNFLVPKLAVIPAILFFNSYLSICLVFAFFALGGAIRLYKLFLHYFPDMRQQAALAALFLPSACYWSAGFLKDSICFGSMGFLLYGLLNVFIRRKAIFASIIWIALATYFLYTIKVYILLALVPGIGFWLFGHLSSGVKTVSLKRAITFLSLVVGAIAAVSLVNYLTSDVALSKFSLDNLLETSSFSREVYERGGVKNQGAYFQITTTNPFLLALNGLVATFFRPFPWEISSAIVGLSAIEALSFLSLILYLFFKRGLFTTFRKIFSKPILILCFTFAIIFAISVGVSATNFGSLSRYKIPCLPFYLIFILAVYHLTGLAYPRWLQKALSWITIK
jgi:hypothetical protein